MDRHDHRSLIVIAGIVTWLAMSGCVGASPSGVPGTPGLPGAAASSGVPGSGSQGAAPSVSSDAQSAAPTQRAFATVPPGASGGEGAVSQAVLDTVFGDLANRTNLTPETFKVTRAQAVTWPDGALGCHEPGRSYVQVLTPGYWILVEAGGKTWDYRAAASGTVKLCALPVRVPPIG